MYHLFLHFQAKNGYVHLQGGKKALLEEPLSTVVPNLFFPEPSCWEQSAAAAMAPGQSQHTACLFSVQRCRHSPATFVWVVTQGWELLPQYIK